MSKGHRFWDRIAEKYARRPVPDEAAYERKLAETRRHLTAESEVLEIGCGTGTTALKHAPLVKRIEATDFSPKMIEIARRKAAAAGIDNAAFEVASVEDLAGETGRYDAVLAMSILHLLADLPGTLAAIHRVVQPGGVFVSSTACLGTGFWWLKLIVGPGHRLGLLPLVRFFTAAELHRAIQAAGFEIETSWTAADGRTEFVVARRPG